MCLYFKEHFSGQFERGGETDGDRKTFRETVRECTHELGIRYTLLAFWWKMMVICSDTVILR